MSGKNRMGRPFARLWLGSTVSSFGDGISLAAVPLLAASLTRDPLMISLLQLAIGLPWLLVGLYAGVLADRFDRRGLMWGSDLARLVLVATLGVLVAVGSLTVPVLLLVVFALGAVTTVFDSAAPALLPDLVHERDLHRANARLMAGMTGGRNFAGPSVGALLFGVLAWAPFAADALTFAASAACIRRLPRTPPPVEDTSQPRSFLREIREGLLWSWRTRTIRILGAGTFLLAFSTGAFISVFVLFVLEELRLPNSAYGLLIALYAVGNLAGSLVSAAVTARLTARWTAHLGAFLCAVAFLGVSLTRSWPVVAIGLMLLGTATAFWNITTATVRQQATPRHLLGRVTGAFEVVANGSVALGGPVCGLVAGALGLSTAMLVPVVAAGLTAALMFWWPSITATDPNSTGTRIC
jgi:MFS family permease